MRMNPLELEQPVFDFIEGIVRDYGDILFMLFTIATIPFLVWVLRGGLRRKSAARDAAIAIPVIVIQRTVVQPSAVPPVIESPKREQRPPDGNDGSAFAA